MLLHSNPNVMNLTDERFLMSRTSAYNASALLPKIVGREDALQFRPGIPVVSALDDLPAERDAALAELQAHDGVAERIGIGTYLDVAVAESYLNDYIAGRRNPYPEDGDTKDDSSGNTPPGDPPTGRSDGRADTQEENEREVASNRGTLILDATCVPQDIRYPTDISLLNEAREILEGMIERVYPKGQKPRTYRKVARRAYLRYAKNRRPTLRLLRKSLCKYWALHGKLRDGGM
jgi:hypothetical protein